MDMTDFQLALPSMLDSNEIYTFEHPYPQCFSLPYPLIKYILKQNSKVWKTCKFFYSKYPIHPFNNLTAAMSNGKWEADDDILDANNLHGCAKLWICNSISALQVPHLSNAISSLIPKIYNCQLGVLEFDKQELSWEEYNVLTSSGTVEWLTLWDVKIRYSDGADVTFDKLLGNFKNMRSITLYLSLNALSETFDFPSITDFLLNNEHARILICYYHSARLSGKYREMLQNFINHITANPPQKIPNIAF